MRRPTDLHLTRKGIIRLAAIAGGVLLLMIGGMIYNRIPPTCDTGSVILSSQKVDEDLAERGYKVLKRLQGQKGCHYRLAITPLKLRAVVIYDPGTKEITLSKWDYLEKVSVAEK